MIKWQKIQFNWIYAPNNPTVLFYSIKCLNFKQSTNFNR